MTSQLQQLINGIPLRLLQPFIQRKNAGLNDRSSATVDRSRRGAVFTTNFLLFLFSCHKFVEFFYNLEFENIKGSSYNRHVNATKTNKHALKAQRGELNEKFVRTLRKFHFSLMVLPGAAWLILFFCI